MKGDPFAQRPSIALGEGSAREKARELLAEFDTNRKAFDSPEMNFDELAFSARHSSSTIHQAVS
jgi:hypothetical protein